MHTAYRNDDLFSFDPNLKGPVAVSVLFHIAVVTLASLGLPYIAKDPSVLRNPVSVEIVEVDDIARTNKVAPPKPEKEQPEKPAPPEPAERQAPPQMTAEEPPDLVTPQAPEIEEIPPPPPPEPEKAEAKPAEKPKPKPEPPEKKPEATKKIENENDFQSILKNLTPDVKTPSKEQEETGPAKSADISQISRLSDRLTISEEDALRRQLGQCWNVPAGAKYAEELVVEVRVIVNPDRTVQQATILDQGRYNRDSYYRAAADAAIRALRNPRCTPLALPPEKYDQWKTTIITFDPRNML